MVDPETGQVGSTIVFVFTGSQKPCGLELAEAAKDYLARQALPTAGVDKASSREGCVSPVPAGGASHGGREPGAGGAR